MADLTSAIVGGLIAGVASPILLGAYKSLTRHLCWAQPREKLLKKLFADPKLNFISLDRLTLVTGTTPDQCRTLLIKIDARGAKLADGREGWTLLPIKFSDADHDLNQKLTDAEERL